ncbi:exopolysaccharide biosynthesis protein [Methanosphaera sp.]
MDSNKEYPIKTSKKLKEIKKSLPDNITIGQLVNELLSEGNYILVIILVAPFLFPVSFPGSSTPFGIMIILLEFASLSGKAVYLPKKASNYVLDASTVEKLFNILMKFLKYIEKISKPRGRLVSNQYLHKVNSVLIILLSFVLFLPLPIPLTDFIPAISILVLSISNLEKDSYLMVLGYLCVIGTFAYFTSVGYVGLETIKLILRKFGILI